MTLFFSCRNFGRRVFVFFSVAFLEGLAIEAVRVIHEAPSGKVTSQPRFDSGALVIAVLRNSFHVGKGHVTFVCQWGVGTRGAEAGLESHVQDMALRAS